MNCKLLRSTLAAQALVLTGVVAAAWTLQSRLALSGFYVSVTALVFAAMMAVALVAVQRSHPFDRFGAANQVTTVRAGLVALVAALLGQAVTPAAAAAAATASFVVASLDFADGWLARRTRMESPFGARFDMEVDAMLIMVLALLAWRHGKAGIWVVASGLVRYVFVVAGLKLRWLSAPLPASRRRQTICVLQMAGLILVVWPGIVPPLSDLLAAVALASLLASFLVDTVWLWRHGAGGPAHSLGLRTAG